MDRLLIHEATIYEADKSHPADESGKTFTIKIERGDTINGENDEANNTNS